VHRHAEEGDRPADPAEELDSNLRRMARERVEFKKHLLVYVVVIGALWVINYLTQMNWPPVYWWAMWPTLGWGVGLVLHGIGAYAGFDTVMAEREYRRLKRKYGSDT
jgi:hypothetical protein